MPDLSTAIAPSVTDELRANPLNWLIVAPVVGLHVMALLAFTQPFQWTYLAVAAGFYTWGALSTSLFLHRCLAHRAFELAGPLRAFFALGTAAGLAGAPVIWVGIHRHHHGHADTPDDAHSPRYGAWFGHLGWAFRLTPALGKRFRALAPDVSRDRYCLAMERPGVYFGLHLAMGALVYLAWGVGGLLWGYYLPMVLLLHATYAVNSIGHLPAFGSRRFDSRDDSRNVGWLALPTLGDSFHNNHHAHPRWAAHGLAWHEIDPTKWVIALFERLGWARAVVWDDAGV